MNNSESRLTNKQLGLEIKYNADLSWNDVTSEYVGKKVGIWLRWIKNRESLKKNLIMTNRFQFWKLCSSQGTRITALHPLI